MECKLIVPIALHLLHNRTPDYLLRADSIGSGFDVVHMLREVLPGQLMYGRDMVKDSADEFQLHRVGMINIRRDQRQLFLILFANFLVAPFLFLRVISAN